MQKYKCTESTHTGRSAVAQAKSWNVHTPGHKPTRSVCPTYTQLSSPSKVLLQNIISCERSQREGLPNYKARGGIKKTKKKQGDPNSMALQLHLIVSANTFQDDNFCFGLQHWIRFL